ncbi:MAG: glycerol-3-phosphate dehydrogenase/oxidase [Bacteroidota bacterium]
MNLLNAKNRPQLRTTLENTQYDLLIIGGGITGAGIALDAASRGLKVALIEKNDFASGTSSKSTKLIHGGLRYLKQFEVQLVREVGRERATVHKLAPHLVVPEKMLLPLTKGGTYGPISTSAGLWVYDILAGVSGEDKRKMLNTKQTLKKEPLLDEKGLVGGGFYAEYRTDDARLTIENVKTAVTFGAHCINYVEASSFIYQNEQITGANCLDKLTGETFQINATYIISSAGPWVDSLRKKDQSLSGKHLFLSKGVHIVLPYEKLPLQQSIYFDNNDGRMLFAIPRHRSTYIGTTDTPYTGDLDQIPIDLEDVNYLLEATNRMFPSIELKVEDVESSWAGLRPLIHEEGKSASEMSRKDEIFESKSGLISIAGGKLTGYRKMAERVVNVVADRMAKTGKDLKANSTTKIPLANGELKNADQVNKYKNVIAQKIQELGLPVYYTDYLVANYGKQTDSILNNLDQNSKNLEEAVILSELDYVLENEMICTILDFFNRRTGRLYFNLPSILPNLGAVADIMAKELAWDNQRIQKEKEKVVKAIDWVSNFSSAKVTT